MSILRQVTFDGANRRKDGSISLKFTTELEQSTVEFMELDEVRSTHGVLYYSEKSDLTQQERDEIDRVEVEVEGKTKSQRLRSTMFVFHTQLLGRKPTAEEFKEFYSSQMEKIIMKYKDKLEDA